MSTPVILIIGAGPNIGAAVAKKFAENGYKVALAARSLSDGVQADGYLHIKADLSDPENVPRIFREVEKNLGIPNMVIYNGPFPLPPSIKSINFQTKLNHLRSPPSRNTPRRPLLSAPLRAERIPQRRLR